MRRTALLLGTLYIFAILFGRLPDRLILFPSTAPIDPGAAVRKPIPFQGGELEIWTAKSQRVGRDGCPDFYVLRFYGNADRAEHWVASEAKAWNGRGVEIWGVNSEFWRQHGTGAIKSYWASCACCIRRFTEKRG